MSDLVVRGGELLTPGRMEADVVIEGGRITDVSFWPRPDPDLDLIGETMLDATGLLVAPGFIDVQCNGAGGIDLTAEPERLDEMAALLPQWGVTAWLPTVVTSPAEIRKRALAALANRPGGVAPVGSGGSGEPVGPVGATPLGLHFEGPFLAPDHRGAHAAAHLRDPDPALVEGWSRQAGVALVTLAPELPGALELIAALVERGVVVALGHSGATADQATAAVDAGARAVTHLFNAMGTLHHREPGLAGVALTDDRLMVGVIADGLHVHPAAVELAARTLHGRLTLVTDAVAALGVPPGPVRLGEVEAVSDGVSVRLKDGTLAGSVLTLEQALGNLMAFAHIELDDAIHSVTTAPARLLGLQDERGILAPGAIGDLVLLDPEGPEGRPEVVATVIGGHVVHDRRR